MNEKKEKVGRCERVHPDFFLLTSGEYLDILYSECGSDSANKNSQPVLIIAITRKYVQ